MLNQYNIHAYKKILRQIDYALRSLQDLSPREIGFAVSRKISKDGKYIGIAVDYNFDADKTTAKIRFTY